MITFNPDIWGTVSDWAMVLVTALTFYFIYRTFKQQQALLGFERIKLKISIKPNLELVVDKNFVVASEDGVTMQLKCTFNKMFLSKIVIAPKQNNTESDILTNNYDQFVEIEQPVFFSYSYLKIEKIRGLSMHGSSTISVHYADVLGTSYKQDFYVTYDPEFKIFPQHCEEISPS